MPNEKKIIVTLVTITGEDVFLEGCALEILGATTHHSPTQWLKNIINHIPVSIVLKIPNHVHDLFELSCRVKKTVDGTTLYESKGTLHLRVRDVENFHKIMQLEDVNGTQPMHPSLPPQHQQQPTDQQRPYAGGQNIVPQATSSVGPNTNNGSGGGRSASTSGPSGQTGAGGPPMTPQYTLNGNVSAAYGYPQPNSWYPAQSQISSPQSNMPPQVNVYGMMFEPSQQAPPQQPAYVHSSPYDPTYYQPAQPPQQGLDSVPTGNYNR